MADKEEAKQEIRKLLDKYKTIIEQGKSSQYNEERTKAEFIEPLFEALGWDIRNKTHTDEVTREEKISKMRVDYGFRINGIPKFFLEAKSLKGDLDNEKFAEQAINYSWHKGCTWAILTNFETLRIYNSEIKAANPWHSNLKSIQCNEFLDRFSELWLLSRESFEQGLLDKEAEKWGKKAKKSSVDKQLLDDFTRFRALLSTNITKLNQSKGGLKEEDLDESVQRILDRLIFIRNCEDRELEEKILISNFREWESGGRGQLIKKLRETFAYFDKQYNSKIFANHLCDALDIDNEVLHEIIEGLYYTKDRAISYDFSAIEADVLGNIYEQYLGHILKKTEKRATITEAHAHRKEQGIYYTPTYIVDYIVRNTLGELLKDKKTNPDKIRVLDPACGSGSFLIKAFDVLNEYHAKHDKNYNQTQLDINGGGATYTRKLKIMQNNIFGVDLDKQAVEVAQLNLLLKMAEKGQRLPLLQGNIKRGNSLIDDETVAKDKAFKWENEFKQIMAEGGFDAVVGNPPYVTIGGKEDANITEEIKNYYSTTYFKSYEYKANYFVLFIERGISLLKNGGHISFIVPRTLLDNLHMKNLRKVILDNTKIKILIELKYHVFEDAETGGNLIFVLEKCSKEQERLKNIVNCLSISQNNSLKEVKYNKIKQSYFLDSEIAQFFVSDTMTINLIDKIKKEKKKLSEICLINNGVNTGNAAKILLSDKKESQFHRKILEGKDINRYSLNWNNLWVNYDHSLKNRIDLTKLDTRQKRIDFSLRNEKLFNSEKIILRQTADRLIGTLDTEKYITRHSTHIIRIKDHEISIKYILGLFNSKLLTYYYRNLIPEKGKAFAEVKAINVEKLPIKIISESQQQPIVKLVDKMLSLNKRLSEIGDKKTDERARIEDEIRKTDKEIDELVYKIYGITDGEKKIIEESLR